MQVPPTPAAVGQVYPASTCLQSAAQPSPALVLPSSQASSPITCESPQTMVETQGFPGVLHWKKGSTAHTPEQPSPGVMLPSSHSSVPFSAPSPQYSSFAHGLPGEGQVHPGSRPQVLLQPSASSTLPSSQ